MEFSGYVDGIETDLSKECFDKLQGSVDGEVIYIPGKECGKSVER